MKILRLSIFLLFTTTLIPIGVSAHCKGKHDVPGHPHCEPGDPPDPGDSITHVVKLTGAFVFDTVNNSVDVTANSKGTELRSADPVTLIRPTDSTVAVWNAVFEQCRFFLPTPVNVPSFTAPSDGKGWTINKEGGVSVAFRKIPFNVPDGNVEVNLYLIGTTPYEDDFLPDLAGGQTTITHTLSRFAIWGRTVKGGTPGSKCHSDSVTGGSTFLGGSELALTITVK